MLNCLVIKKKPRNGLFIPQSLVQAIFNTEKKLSCYRIIDASTACFRDTRVFVKSRYYSTYISLTVYNIDSSIEILTLCIYEKVSSDEDISPHDVERMINYLNSIISTFIEINSKIIKKEPLNLDDVENYLRNIYAIKCKDYQIGNYLISNCTPTGLGWQLMSLCRPLQLLRFAVTNDIVIHLVHEYEVEGGSMSDYFGSQPFT